MVLVSHILIKLYSKSTLKIFLRVIQSGDSEEDLSTLILHAKVEEIQSSLNQCNLPRSGKWSCFVIAAFFVAVQQVYFFETLNGCHGSLLCCQAN